MKAYDFLKATNRVTDGRGYDALRSALIRLQGTQIETNIVTGETEQLDIFSIIDRARIVRQTRDGRMQEIEVQLSDWVFNAIRAKEVLTFHRDYFRLRKPIERRLYELARKHCGLQTSFRIGLEKLRAKCGSQSTLKEFRRMVQSIIEDDQAHDHMPGYIFKLTEDMLEIQPKQGSEPPAPLGPVFNLSESTYETGRSCAPGWDIYALEAEWRGWVAKKDIRPMNPDGHFLAFCKRRGKYPGFR